MKKAEAEGAIRQLCHTWAKLKGIEVSPSSSPNFYEFRTWLNENHYSYTNFRTTTGVDYDIRRWFDNEMRQDWKN